MPDDRDLVLTAVRKCSFSRLHAKHPAFVDGGHDDPPECYTLRLVQLRVERLAQLVEDALQIRRQLASELHPPIVTRMCERAPRGVEKRTVQMRDRPHIARHAAVNPGIQRIADDRMPDT